jgi:uncharacterized OB-fold protein
VTLDTSNLTTRSDDELVARLPGVVLDQETKWFYSAWLDRRLVAAWCPSCEAWSLPLRARCPACWSDVTVRDLSGQGQVFLATRVLQPAGHYGSGGPPTSATVTVELREQEGLRWAGEVIDCDDVTIGMDVELVWVEVDGLPCPHFRPADPSRRASR